MKATIDIPDELYRQVKSKSALRGQAVREVAIHLFQGWVLQIDEPVDEPAYRGTRPASPVCPCGSEIVYRNAFIRKSGTTPAWGPCPDG